MAPLQTPKWLKNTFTLLIIPAGTGKVVRLKLNIPLFMFFAALLFLLVFMTIYLATMVSGSNERSRVELQALATAGKNDDKIQTELQSLNSVFVDFYSSLLSTWEGLSAVPQFSQAARNALSETNQLSQLKNITASLNSAIPSMQELSSALITQRQLLSDIPNHWPVTGGLSMLTMEFGPNFHPIRGSWYLHKGVDIAGSLGLIVVASANGRVIEASRDTVSGYGLTVTLEHKYGFKTRYAHLGRIDVKVGDEIAQGARVGTLGSTGLSTGAHTHFEIILGDQVLDPTSFLKISNDFKRWEGDRPVTYE